MPTPKVRRLAGGNPQIAKADGDAPVQAYIAAMPDWKRDIGRRLDALIVGGLDQAGGRHPGMGQEIASTIHVVKIIMTPLAKPAVAVAFGAFMLGTEARTEDR